MSRVSALFVDPLGIYPELLDRGSCWCGDPNGAPGRKVDDARCYAGPHSVVAHPPCNLWVNFAAQNWQRYKRQKPAWYPGGTDEGCFASALASVRKYGGVLEHPAGSHAWAHHGLASPVGEDGRRSPWLQINNGGGDRYWTCEIWQSVYGHKARKRTWLLYCGKRPPFELDWRREPGTHQCGWFDRKKPTLSKKEASATPIAFAKELIKLAKWSRG